MNDHYQIPDDIHPEVQKTMTTKTIEVKLPPESAELLKTMDMKHRAEIVQQGYNLLDSENMTLMAAAKREKTVKSPWKRFKKKVLNLFRRKTSPPSEFQHRKPVVIPFKFNKIKANMQKLAETTGLTLAQAMQLTVLKSLNHGTDMYDHGTYLEQLETVKSRLGVETDGETRHVDEMETDYTSKDHTLNGGELQ